MSYKLCAFADEASNAFSGQIRALVDNGIKYLEIRNLDRKNIADLSISEAKELRKRLDDEGLSVWSVGSRIGKIGIRDDFSPHVDEFLHTLELARALECENLRMFSFYIPKGDSPDAYGDEAMERLGRFVELSRGSGVTLCHENEKGIYGDVTERCLKIAKAFDEIKLVFDPANFVQCRVNTLDAWDMLRGYVKYMHIKDALADGSIVPAGKGEGNIPTLLGKYAKIGGEVLTLEPHLVVFDGLQALEKESVKEKTFIYRYETPEIAFKAAADALKALI